jgi:DNA-binding MarR family transcriptional regulator/ribosomal protein S18 acetylase RimI-like enzyme
MNNSIKNNSFLFGSRLKKIGENITSQVGKICRDHKVDFETRWIPVISALFEKGELSVQSLADYLGITHPAVVQLTNQLLEKGFIKTEKLTADKRVKIISITEKGKEKFELLKPTLNEIESSINSLLSKTGYDVMDVISKLEDSLASEKIIKNISDKIKEKQLRDVKIVPYHKKYKKDFKKLNIEWLEKYFTVEPTDKKIIDSPEEEIINKGGGVFFALLNNEVIGTCAVIKVDRKTYELTKMAVTEKAQGKQVGNKLGLTVIGFAVSRRAKKLVLDTNHKLIAAIHLYRKLGFVTIPYEFDNKYERELIRMKLNLR